MSKEAKRLALEVLQMARDGETGWTFLLPEAIKALEASLVMQEGSSNFCPQCEALGRELKALKSSQGPVGAVADGEWYFVRYEGLGKVYEAPALYRDAAKAFYSVDFSGIPAHQVEVISACSPVKTR